MDPILAVWNSLSNENPQLLEVEGSSFDYPTHLPSLKGIFKSYFSPSGKMRFMSFVVAMNSFADGVLESSQKVVLTFYQTQMGHWVFSTSTNPNKATFSQPMPCCEHAVELVEKLSKNEPGELHILDADGNSVTVKMSPLNQVLN